MKCLINFLSVIWGIMFFSAILKANPDKEHVGVITKLYGDVKILSNPSQTKEGSGPHVLYESKFYTLKKASIGDQLPGGSIIQTGANARAKIVYNNGDQFVVSPLTFYQVRLDVKDKEVKPIGEVVFGTLRAVINHNGPRNKMQFKARSLTMGVRGTDFCIISNTATGASEVTVLRGRVEVKPNVQIAKADIKPMEIPAGYSAQISIPQNLQLETSTLQPKQKEETLLPQEPEKQQKDKNIIPSVPIVQIKQASKQDLLKIQEQTKIESKEVETPKDENIQKIIETLEQKALETTLEDIKKEDSNLYSALSNIKPKSSDDISTVTVKTLFEKAPEAPKPAKPSKHDLDILKEDVYEKYFKID